MTHLKYNAHLLSTEDGVFASKKEYERWLILKLRLCAGDISSLHRQVRFQILPRITEEIYIQGKRKRKRKEKVLLRAHYYTCDFLYRENGFIVIEEVKSKITATRSDYKLRKDLMLRLLYKKNNDRGRTLFIFREVI